MNELLDLALLFGKIGLYAVGGVVAVIPEIQREVVHARGWMDDRTFATLFTLGQAAPGPNLLVVTLIGWIRAGLAGALVSTFGLIALPACVIYGLTLAWPRLRAASWLAPVQTGLNSITIGLIAAAGILLSRAAASSWVALALTAATVAILLSTKKSPLLLLAIGAAIGALGLV
jgi:chromate transporter